MGAEQHFWDELTARGIVGVERSGALPTAPAGPLGQLITRIDGGDAASALLDATALTACYLRAGQQVAPPAEPTAFAPCELEDLEVCSPEAERHLALMLGGINQEALAEWLAALARSHRRVPEAQLPTLLERGRSKAELRPLISPVLGRRGRWLAALNPHWNFAPVALPDDTNETTLETQWSLGDTPRRLALLQRLRAEQPERAHELLATTWERDAANDRVAFLASLRLGLSMADEPLLEAALDDRSKLVRRSAADLLARLAGSRLVQRMTARVTPLLAWKRGGLLTKAKILVTLPDEPDPALIRDGVETKQAAPGKAGVRADQLSRMLAVVPPGHWCALWGKTPAEIIAAAQNGEWGELLLESLPMAALNHGDAAWAEALLSTSVSDGLIALLSPERRSALALALLRRHPQPLDGKHPALELLLHLPRPWSLELARAVLASLRQHIERQVAKGHHDWRLAEALPRLAAAMPPELAQEASGDWLAPAREAPHWKNNVEKFERLLLFRQTMLKEVSA
jgi:hypothetical protein